MQPIESKMVEGGRIVVPTALRRVIGIAKDDTVDVELHGGELRVQPVGTPLRRIRLVRRCPHRYRLSRSFPTNSSRGAHSGPPVARDATALAQMQHDLRSRRSQRTGE